MPVLESVDGGMPRSALRYRSLDEANKRSVVTTAAHPVIQRASRPRPRPADDDLISEWKRGDAEEAEHVTAPGSLRKVKPPVRRSRSGSGVSRPARTTAPVPVGRVQAEPRARIHPLVFLGLGMLGMLVLWVLLSAGLGWWTTTLNDLRYGNPRTFQVDAVVGHNDSTRSPSHFLALNLHGHIEIIEFPGGDGTHARIYLGPQLFGSDAEKAPVTLRFADVNGDGRADMLVFFQASWIVFINDQGTFRPPTPTEQQDAARYLTAHPQS